MVEFVNVFNLCIFIIFILFYAYQLFFILVSLVLKKRELGEPKKLHRFAFVIAARNESAVIGGLLESIKAQDYPKGLIDIFVVADNCTDNTAEIARREGAFVYERNNREKVGKGYALDFVFGKIRDEHHDRNIEAFIIFDADNLVTKRYVGEINRVFDAGYNVCTSYRNSKNYNSNWISAGYSLWFLREAKFLNNARMILNTSCAVSGTGFMISKDIVEKNGGWKYTLLTEDIEFSVDCAIKGEKIGYAADAEFFDEQPISFRQSWVQRMRWAKGFYQVFSNYGFGLVKGMFSRGGFACYDMLMTIMPALIVSFICMAVNTLIFVLSVLAGQSDAALATLSSLGFTAVNFYLTLFVISVITVISEWNKIPAPNGAKVLYTFTFPLFMFTYLPIAITALFKKIEWQPIKHSIPKKINEMKPDESD